MDGCKYENGKWQLYSRTDNLFIRPLVLKFFLIFKTFFFAFLSDLMEIYAHTCFCLRFCVTLRRLCYPWLTITRRVTRSSITVLTLLLTQLSGNSDDGDRTEPALWESFRLYHLIAFRPVLSRFPDVVAMNCSTGRIHAWCFATDSGWTRSSSRDIQYEQIARTVQRTRSYWVNMELSLFRRFHSLHTETISIRPNYHELNERLEMFQWNARIDSWETEYPDL